MTPDRVLLLDAPPPNQIRALAQRLAPGSIVCCLANPDQTYDLRRELTDLRNVLIVPAAEDGLIPWQDEFFTAVHAPHLPQAPAEALRVLAPGGLVHLAGGVVTRR